MQLKELRDQFDAVRSAAARGEKFEDIRELAVDGMTMVDQFGIEVSKMIDEMKERLDKLPRTIEEYMGR